MKINNRKNTRLVMYCLFLILSLDIICLLLPGKIYGVNPRFLYTGCLAVFVLTIWRIAILRVFSIEISEHIISVKYEHLFLKTLNNKPALEIPLQKVSSYRLERGIVDSFLIIDIHTREGVKSSYYRLGILSKKQADKFKRISNTITFITSYTKNGTGL